MDNKEVRYLQQFKGGSMAKTYLIKKDKKQFVRKEVRDTSGLGLDKLEKQADWILNLEPEVSKIFPIVVTKDFNDSYGYYDMTYHDMPSFRDYLIEVGEINDDIRNLLKEIVSYGAQIVSKEEKGSKKNKETYIAKSHLEKMHERCDIVVQKDKTFTSFFYSNELLINGQKQLNLRDICFNILNDNDLLELLSPKTWNRSHGDFTFQNILTNGKEFKIIDPRGEGEDSIYYDISKLFQSVSGKYDLFIEDNYEVDYSLNNFSIDYKIKQHEALFNEAFEIIKEEIPKAFSVEKEWEIITLFFEASHFISMAPFRYEENLAFTLACYAIGIEKLNEVLSKWEELKK